MQVSCFRSTGPHSVRFYSHAHAPYSPKLPHVAVGATRSSLAVSEQEPRANTDVPEAEEPGEEQLQNPEPEDPAMQSRKLAEDVFVQSSPVSPKSTRASPVVMETTQPDTDLQTPEDTTDKCAKEATEPSPTETNVEMMQENHLREKEKHAENMETSQTDEEVNQTDEEMKQMDEEMDQTPEETRDSTEDTTQSNEDQNTVPIETETGPVQEEPQQRCESPDAEGKSSERHTTSSISK